MGGCQCSEDPLERGRRSQAIWQSKHSSFFAYTPSHRTLRSIEIDGVTLKIIKGMIIDERVDVLVN